MTLRVANGAGFLGDNLDAPRLLVESAEVDYLTLEYLAELTLSVLTHLRKRDETAGYARDFIEVLQSLCPSLSRRPNLHIVTNAGGINAVSCARAAAKVLVDADLGDESIGVVLGDDLLDRLDLLRAAGCRFENLDTNEPLEGLNKPVVSANAYLGAAPVAAALAGGARIVLTGRVADASLTVGPAVHEFGWAEDDWNRLAAASVAGHLIECGAQVTGGYSANWRDVDLTNVGYPIAELSEDGQTVITKPSGTGGAVNRATVVEQLVYEIGDPRHYLTPDVDVDFTTVEVCESGPDRVTVYGATGRPAPDSYKVSLAYHDGYMASGQLLVYGSDCIEKARAAADLIVQRVGRAGFSLDRTNVELLGAGCGVPGMSRHSAHDAPGRSACAQVDEVVLRITACDARREAVQRFTKELAPLITSGPAGLAGYAIGRSRVRPVYAFWPTLVRKDLIQPVVEVRSAKEWSRR